jgi:hypothetical protein
MKKISIIIGILLISVSAVTWLYFKNLSDGNYTNENVFKVIPKDAAIVFEYKNEDSFYEIFKDFNLFEDLLGKKSIAQLRTLKELFIDQKEFSSSFTKSNLFFSLHQTKKNNSEILIVAPLSKDGRSNLEELVASLKANYQLSFDQNETQPLYQMIIKQQPFYFVVHQALLIGSFDKNLVSKTISSITKEEEENAFAIDFNSQRNKNSIANMYINFAKIPDFLNNFSDKTNSAETFSLKNFDAIAALNINYQSKAFMFSGITYINQNAKNYINLFLTQEPGNNTLKNIIPLDAANYSCFYVSNYKKFKQDLNELFISRNEAEKRTKQIEGISQKHSINIEEELFPITGHEFGLMQLASGDKLGVIKTNNTNRMSFLLSTISSETTENIRHLDEANLFYYLFGDPFKNFTRPYYLMIENHLIIASNRDALQNFEKSYTNQKLLSTSDKNIAFQQYLSNQGNVFYFMHNSNSKSVFKSHLSKQAYQNFMSKQFNWKNFYGLSVQFSADKNRFFTNLYMSKLPDTENILPKLDSLALDSVLN